jgi:RNA 2',3'-cyclic 3'-phosphodiesterase
MRVFLAVDLDESLRTGIAAVQQSLSREGLPRIRWSNPRGIHLTLRFCGEIPEETSDGLARSLSPGAPMDPTSVAVGGLGTFPRRGSPRVLYLGVRGEEALAGLAAWVEERTVSAGLPREPRPFHPHLTLGRFHPGARTVPTELLDAPFARSVGTLSVETIIMFESHLEPAGARYEALRSFPLLGAAP